MEERITRRNFLKVGGLTAGALAIGSLAACTPSESGSPAGGEPGGAGDAPAGGAAGGAPGVGAGEYSVDYVEFNHPFKIAPARESEITTPPTECDYLVIGSGNCGMTSAARAAERGLKVIVLEKASVAGGASVATEAHFALDTVQYVAEHDHPTWTKREAYDYFMFFNNYRSNATLVSEFLNHHNEPLDWFIDKGAQVRMLLYALAGEKTGAGLFFEGRAEALSKISQEVLASNGGEIMLSTPATKLVTDEGGAVVGALATSEAGEEVFIKAKATFVGTGGFGRNADMIHYYMGFRGDNAYAGDTFLEHDGDGVNMLLGVGGVDGGMRWSQGQTPNVPDVAYGEPLDRAASEPYLWVNKYGKRVGGEFFTNLTVPFEVCSYSPDAIYFNIFDSTMVTRMETEPFFTQSRGLPYTFDPEPNMGAALEEGVTNGLCYKADTLEALAEAAGIAPEGLVGMVEEYNALCAAGEDTMFFKDPAMLLPIAVAPFYAVPCIPSRLSTLNGVYVNERLKVLDKDGKPIPGLYAGGLDCGSMFMTDYNHAFSGSASTFSFFTGFHAADTVADEILGA
ncbi:MAG: FAD-binding protein [Coriobacteriales bacterium]|nr:FAD-binding protein [Coriobacteriales bacterium]